MNTSISGAEQIACLSLQFTLTDHQGLAWEGDVNVPDQTDPQSLCNQHLLCHDKATGVLLLPTAKSTNVSASSITYISPAYYSAWVCLILE